MHQFTAVAARRFLGAASLAVLTASVAASQGTGTIRGHVTDSTAGTPLGNAQVTVTGTNAVTTSSATGDYVLTNVPAGAREVVARRVGYARGVQRVTVS